MDTTNIGKHEPKKIDTSNEKDYRELPQLEEFKSGDGAHRGLSDWYENKRVALQKALDLGPLAEWTTGWYGSKHAIASCLITHQINFIQVTASVSDDFDTDGSAYDYMEHTTDLEKLAQCVDQLHGYAEQDRKDNQQYLGFSIYTTDNRGLKHWVETYVRPFGDGEYLDQPPGDNYHVWGFQGEADEFVPLSEAVRKRLKEWADNWPVHEEPSLTVEGFIIEPWDAH